MLRKYCTKDSPMPKNNNDYWLHDNVEEIGESYDGSCVDYKCKNCGHEWRSELA